jgi:nucleoside 2-deoxyribosyltransferase
MDKMKIYLASPFFNPVQIEARDKVCNALREWGHEVASPEELSKDIWNGRKPSECTKEERFKVFSGNLLAIDESDLVVAIIDNWDVGTCWEMGFSYAMETPVVAYSDVPKRGLNLMISSSCIGFANGIDNLKAGLNYWENLPALDRVIDYKPFYLGRDAAEDIE